VKDELKDLKDCWTGGVLIEHQIAAAIKLFEKGGKINMTKAIFSLKDVVMELPKEISDCKSVVKDVAAISGWGAAVSGLFLPAKIGTNLITHHSAIFAHFKALKSDIADKNYWKMGEDVADILSVAIGPVHTPKLTALPPAKGVAEFVEGLLKQWGDDNKLDQSEACIAGLAPLEDDIKLIVQDLEAKDVQGAILKIKDLVAKFPVELQGCESAKPELQAIAEWAKIFTDKEKLAKDVAKNVALHHKKITEDVEAVKADWTSG